MDERVFDIFKFQVERNIVSLYKKYLEILQDIQSQHVSMLNKLNSLDPKMAKELDLVDYFDEEEYNYLRKKILDAGNDTKREIERALENVKKSNN
jgi:rubrerythrin